MLDRANIWNLGKSRKITAQMVQDDIYDLLKTPLDQLVLLERSLHERGYGQYATEVNNMRTKIEGRRNEAIMNLEW